MVRHRALSVGRRGPPGTASATRRGGAISGVDAVAGQEHLQAVGGQLGVDAVAPFGAEQALEGGDLLLGGFAFLVAHGPYGQKDAAGGGHQPGRPGE